MFSVTGSLADAGNGVVCFRKVVPLPVDFSTKMDFKYLRLQQIQPSGRSYKCGVAYKYRNILTNDIVVGRSFAFDEEDAFDEEHNSIPTYILRNVNMLKEMDHNNIIRLVDVVCWKNHMQVFVEAGYITWVDFMKKYPEQSRDPHAIKIWLRQILSGVEYCQSHGIIYEDLNPLKCLVDVHKDDVKCSVIKLADAGFAWVFGYPLDIHTTPVRSYWYEAPEIYLGATSLTNAADLWSVGCIFAEMVNQRPLFFGGDKFKHLLHISRLLGTPSEKVWREAKQVLKVHGPKDLGEEVNCLEPAGVDLLSKMLRWDPSERITASDALKHPYFDGL